MWQHNETLVLDPGDSTGWVYRQKDGVIIGGTVDKNLASVAQLIIRLAPKIVVYETFALYPGKAQKMIWNSFYPVEVIGVIKYVTETLTGTGLVGLSPSVKNYAGDVDFTKVNTKPNKPTEHTKDAMRLLTYFERNYK